MFQDLAFAVRALRRRPAFALTAILTLALGIGASTAIFSVMRAVLLQPLPYRNADRLGLITQDLRVRNVVDFGMAGGDLPDIRAGATLFDGVAAIETTPVAPFGDVGSPPEAISLADVTTNIFDVLGASILHGRNFTADDGAPMLDTTAGATPPPVIGILGYGFWKRRFGSDTAIVGKTITVFGGPVQVVGVAGPEAEVLLPARLGIDRYPDVFEAVRVNFATASRQSAGYRFLGRMKPGVTVGAARAQVDAIGQRLAAQFPQKQGAGVAFRFEPLKEYLVAGVRPVVVALMGAVLLLLLIACANVANLLLVRAVDRERELAVRAALGGSASSLVRHLLAEALVIAVGAAVVGSGLAWAGVAMLARVAPPDLPRRADIGVDSGVLAFAVVASAVSAVIIGLLPAVRVASPQLATALRATGRAPSLSGATRLRGIVVVAEVALSFVLLVGCGLMIRSFLTVVRVDPGFEPAGALTFSLTNLRFQSPDEARAFVRTARDRLAAIPGVSAVTNASALPLTGDDPSARWGTVDAAANPTAFRQGAFYAVLPGYFEAMRTPVVSGRVFTEADDAVDQRLLVIDDDIARRAFGQEPAVGKTLLVRVRTPDAQPYTVIGVVRHPRHLTLTGDEKEVFFLPLVSLGGLGRSWMLRTAGDPAALAPSVREAVASVNPQALITEMRPMTELVGRAMASTRFALVLIGVFAVVAGLLAAVGLYGVLSSAVRLRTPEIGIRKAFGAQTSSIFSLMIGEGLRLSIAGLVLGLVLARLGTQAMESMLVGVAPTDPLTFVVIAVLFLVVAIIACLVPARRAATLDPNVALRDAVG